MAPFDSTEEVATALDAPLRASPATFREVLARLAGGLAIVSYWNEDKPGGLLVSSITGLSIEPPRFLFCVQKISSSHAALSTSDVCGVTILSVDEHSEAKTFIDPGLRRQRFRSGRWRLGAPTPPLLDGGLSSCACSIDARIEGGSHTIFIVTALRAQVNDGAPLLWFNRGVGTLSEIDVVGVPPPPSASQAAAFNIL